MPHTPKSVPYSPSPVQGPRKQKKRAHSSCPDVLVFYPTSKPHYETYLPVCTGIPKAKPSCQTKYPVQEVQMSYFTQRETEAGGRNHCANRHRLHSTALIVPWWFLILEANSLLLSLLPQPNPAMVTCGLSALPSLWAINKFLLPIKNEKSPRLPLSKVTRYSKSSGRVSHLKSQMCWWKRTGHPLSTPPPFSLQTWKIVSYLGGRGKEIWLKKKKKKKTENFTTSEEGDSKDKCGLTDSAAPSRLANNSCSRPMVLRLDG